MKGKILFDKVTLIDCECGCGQLLYKRDRWGALHRSKHGHYKRSKETREKLRKRFSGNGNNMFQRFGSLNPNYGNLKEEVGYTALHHYVRRNKPPPPDGLCELCNKSRWHHLANITDIYNRDSKNWSYLCSKCHFKIDAHLHPREKNLFTKNTASKN